MNPDEISSEVVRILRHSALAGSQREIQLDEPLGEQGLGLDSLPLLEFVLALEKSFGIDLPDAIWARRQQLTLRHFVNFIVESRPRVSRPSREPDAAAAATRPFSRLYAVHGVTVPEAESDARKVRAGDRLGFLAYLRADIARARKENVGPGWLNQKIKILLFPGTWAVVSYRFSQWALTVRLPVVRHLLLLLAAIARGFILLIAGVNISPRAEIGPGLVIHTNYGIFVSPSKIGANCTLQSGVLIAYGVGHIGDNVYFGPGAKVVENASIGSNVVVAANSLVVTDVPDDTTVMGVPARIQFSRTRVMTFERTTARD